MMGWSARAFWPCDSIIIHHKKSLGQAPDVTWHCKLPEIWDTWVEPSKAEGTTCPWQLCLFTVVVFLIYFSFQFCWGIVDIQPCIGLRCAASWLDVRTSWNDDHREFREGSPPHTDTKSKKKYSSLWCQLSYVTYSRVSYFNHAVHRIPSSTLKTATFVQFPLSPTLVRN